MSKIVYKGKTYYSVFEMPTNIRQAYEREQKKARSAETKSTAGKPLTDIVDMSPEVKKIYERAASNVEEKSGSSRPLEDLPKTEDIYRQSAPADMKHLQSDESLYQPSRPVVDPIPSTIEPEEGVGMRGLIWGILVALVLTGIAFLISQFLL